MTTPPKDQEPTAEQAEQIEKAYQSYVQGNRAPWVEGLLSAAYVINRRTTSPEVARLTERVRELEARIRDYESPKRTRLSAEEQHRAHDLPRMEDEYDRNKL